MSNMLRNNIFSFLICFIFSLILYLSLDINQYKKTTYYLEIRPDNASEAPIQLIFYGNTFKNHKNEIRIPETGWKVHKDKNHVIVYTSNPIEPLIIEANSTPITTHFLKSKDGGIAHLTFRNGNTQSIDLRDDTNTHYSFYIGGPQSISPSSLGSKYPSYINLLVFIFIFFIFAILVFIHNKMKERAYEEVRSSEFFIYALPLVIISLLIQLSFFPGQATYDSALQWHQAYKTGQLNPAIGITTTLFMRIFARISSTPWILIIFQLLAAASAFSLVIIELRRRGIPKYIGKIIVLCLALSPQYGLFFTYISKDPLSSIGLILLVYFILKVTRKFKNEGAIPLYDLVLLSFSGVFAGMIRVNFIPSVACTVILLSIFLYLKKLKKEPAAILISYFLMAFLIPKTFYMLSAEYSQSKNHPEPKQEEITDFPYGVYPNLPTYHFFSAAVNSGIEIDSEDSKLFYALAPRESWSKYDCYMTDSTFTSVTQGLKMNSHEAFLYQAKNQKNLIKATLRILEKNPHLIWERQKCITSILWYIGYKQLPFQTTMSTGYDSVTPEFLSIAGENRSVIGRSFKKRFLRYFTATNEFPYFWIVWKPALITIFSLFAGFLILFRKRDFGLILCYVLPIISTLVLAVLIPFPAYRYQYPSVLIFFLLISTLMMSDTSKKQT